MLYGFIGLIMVLATIADRKKMSVKYYKSKMIIFSLPGIVFSFFLPILFVFKFILVMSFIAIFIRTIGYTIDDKKV